MVALLIQKKVRKIEDAFEVTSSLGQFVDPSQMKEAFDEAQFQLTPRWEKKVLKMIDSGLKPPEEPWMDFEQMRLQVENPSEIVQGYAFAAWSPVEVWIALYRDGVFYLRSMLTDEDIYIYRDKCIPAGCHRDAIKNRAVTQGNMSARPIKRLFGVGGHKAIPEVSEVPPAAKAVIDQINEKFVLTSTF